MLGRLGIKAKATNDLNHFLKINIGHSEKSTLLIWQMESENETKLLLILSKKIDLES